MGAKGKINPITGCTDGKLNSTLRSALRQVWSRTVKKEYVKSVRFKHNGRFHVRCGECGLLMATADKKKPVNKDGTISKRKAQKLYDVHHTEGITPLSHPITGLGPYWESMMLGPLEVLCKACHAKETHG